MRNQYKITKKFVRGVLEGLTITEQSSVPFEVGRIYTECIGSGAYQVLGVSIYQHEELVARGQAVPLAEEI